MRYKLLDEPNTNRLWKMREEGKADAYVFNVSPNQDNLYHLGVDRFNGKEFLGLSAYNTREYRPEDETKDMEYEKEDMTFYLPHELCDYACDIIVWFKMYRHMPWEYDIWSD